MSCGPSGPRRCRPQGLHARHTRENRARCVLASAGSPRENMKIAACTALVLLCVGTFEPRTTASAQTAAPASASLEILEVRPTFFVIAGAGANVGVQVGEDGVVVVDT